MLPLRPNFIESAFVEAGIPHCQVVESGYSEEIVVLVYDEHEKLRTVFTESTRNDAYIVMVDFLNLEKPVALIFPTD